MAQMETETDTVCCVKLYLDWPHYICKYCPIYWNCNN